MKVLVLNGSPKEKSDTMHLTNAFVKGIQQSGEHAVEVMHLIKKQIKPCTGCFGCWQIQNGRCVQQDDQNAILESMQQADVIIWSFPLYYYGMPSHVKAVLDRTIPFAKMSMREENGVVMHDSVVDMSGKRYVVISGCGFPNWEGNFDSLKLQCETAFGKQLTMVCVPETPMLNVPSAEPLTAPLLGAFEEAGKVYGETLCLPDEMKERLETPMLPNDVYIQIVNQNA